MIKSVVRPQPVTVSSRSVSRILVIEPDAPRAGILEDLLRAGLDIDLVVVKRVEDALGSIADEIPDLVLTSTFLPPADEALLAAQFRKMPASHVQIVNVPYFLDTDIESPDQSSRSKGMGFFGRRAARLRPACDADTLKRQIEDYLNHAVTLRAERRDNVPNGVVWPPRKVSGLWSDPKPQPDMPVSTGTLAGPREVRLKADPRRDRRRAQRRNGTDVPSLWTVRLPWGDAVRIVDISNSGVLLESGSKVAPGTTIDLQLVGEGTNIFVPAKTIRTDVADVDGLGVRYRLAAAFSHDVNLPAGAATRTGVADRSPGALADVLRNALADVGSTTSSSEVRARFESNLRGLLRLRDVQIRETPVIADHASESIYFTIPQSSGAKRILQVIFEPGEAPSETEFRLLKAAATAAALVLEFAPLIEAPRPRLRLLRD